MVMLVTNLLLVAFTLSGCNEKKSESGETQANESDKILIGLSMADLKEERWQRDRDYFVSKAKELGADVIVQDAGGDPNAQLRQCDALLAKGVKLLVVIPKNADAARPIVQNAKTYKVPVISYDRLIGNAPVDLYLSFNNVVVGEIQAKAIMEKVPSGNYLILKGDPGDKNSDMIHQGHMNIIKEAIGKKEINVVVNQYCDKWMRSEAQRIAADALSKHKIDAIIASNDGTASGAIAALKDKGLAGKIPVSGQDADLQACQNVAKGLQTVTVYKPIKQLAEIAAAEAVKKIKEGSFSPPNSNIKNGPFDVPVLFLPPIPVTKENLKETVIKDGFHSEKDVFGE